MPTNQKSSMPVALRSMKIQKDLKRYYWSKYCYLRSHNGPKFAADVFKQLRQVVMSYIDDENRKQHLEDYIQRCPVRKNGWLRRLFVYADVQPILVIQFLKLYTTEREPVVTAEEAAHAMRDELHSATEAAPNRWLEAWLYAITHISVIKAGVYNLYHGRPSGIPQPNTEFVIARHVQAMKKDGRPLKEIFALELDYLRKMSRILRPRRMKNDYARRLVQNSLPTLRSYMLFRNRPIPTDYDETGGFVNGEFNPFEEDLNVLFSIMELWDETQIIVDALPEGLQDLQGEVNGTLEGEEFQVGNIRQIPKSGTVVRRAIADPNKFLQAGLRPFQKFLRSITAKIPNNCQFEQRKMNPIIKDNIEYGYAGSVDLHQATDWLPLDWFLQIEGALSESWYPIDPAEAVLSDEHQMLDEVLWASRGLAMKMARGPWWNEDDFDSWNRGQPLGTAPSFEILTITHFGVVESLAWCCQRFDSPYALLGDDLVIFDKATRVNYISLMQKAGNPLSMHKSYSGRLTEFAGQCFVRHQATRYITDIPVIGWSNLFDYQRSTGVSIPYRMLPKEVKSRLVRMCSHTPAAEIRPEDLYTAMQRCAGVESDTKVTEVIGALVENYKNTEAQGPIALDKHLYGFVYSGYAGTFDKEVVLPITRLKAKWWTKKNRPETTTSIAKRCLAITD